MTFLRKLTTITSASTLFLTVLVASPTSADSHTPTQVADSVAGASGSSPYSGVVFNGKYYFNAYDPVNHYELRVFDGTNPPSLVQDIRSGASSANPAELTVFGDKLYFRADNGTNGNELWVYDGTNPASMVKDIYVGANAGNPEQLTVFDDRLYFRADNGTNGRELWVYDGTNPASMVQDIYGGSLSSMPQYLTVFNNKLYFQANDGTNGYELWVYDGTNASIVQDLRAGAQSGTPAYLTVFDDKLYFQANDGTNGSELWVYDGTNPASMVQDIRLGANSSTPKDLTVFGGKLYFAATDGTNGVEPWVFDGTSATGFDINTAGSSIEDDWMMGVNPHFAATSMGLFFRATDGATGFELWTIAPAPAPAPAFATPTKTSDGFTVQVSNYDANFTWSVSASAGSATISGTGLITVTGLGAGASATITAQTTRSGYTAGSATVSGSALDAAPAAPAPVLPYSGPTLDSIQSVVAGEQVSFTGRRLHYVSSAYAGPTKLSIVSGVSKLLVLEVPASLAAGSYDLVLYSSHGKLTFNQGLTITAPASEVTQLEVIEPEVVKKLTVGSFKGFIAIYSQGYEGAKLSAKVAGKWLVVDALDESFKGNDYSRTVRFTGTGYNILVHLYINGELIKTEELMTQ